MTGGYNLLDQPTIWPTGGSLCLMGLITLILDGFSDHELIWLRTSDPEITLGENI